MNNQTQHRMTKQRLTLLNELKSVKDHPTADELFQRVRETLPRISLATVYRNLELLSEQGLIKTIEMPGMPRRYDGDVYPHYHLRCVECNRVVDIDSRVVPDISSVIRQTGHYEILAMRLEFDGICEECRKKQESESAR